MPKIKLSPEVNSLLDKTNHPFHKEIDELRLIILAADSSLSENVKWNGPNYSVGENDRITIQIQPPKPKVQLILHRGAKVIKAPKGKLIEDASGLLDWKGNDRAVITFTSMDEIKSAKKNLADIVKKWIKALE